MSGALPELRFPEFTQPIKPVKLGDVASFSKGKGVSKADIDPNGSLPCVRYGELYTVYGTVIDEPVSRTTVPAKDLILSKGGEVLVPASGETARDIATATVVKRSGVAIGGDLNIIRSDHDGAYLASYLSGRKRLALAAMAQGNSVVHLYAAQLGSLDVHLPDVEEERKVSKFLAQVDAKLAALREKVDGLRQFKTGLMQRLFSQELRFTREDGSDHPDWEDGRLADVAQIFGGGTPDSNVPEYWNGDIPWFTPTEIKTKYLQNSVRRISDLGLKNSSAKMLPPGSLILSTRATVGEVGISSRPCSTNQGFQSLVVHDGQYNEFWYYWIRAHKHKFLRNAAGSTFLEIGKSEVQKLDVSMPCFDEQRKIADALSALDAKIDAVTDQITHMETFKKGLLQKMFV